MSKTVTEAALERKVADLERKLERLTASTPNSIAFHDGDGTRVRIGLQDDGSYGLRVWNAAGILVHNYTA